MAVHVMTAKADSPGPPPVALVRPGAAGDGLQQAILAWEQPVAGTEETLRDFHFLAVFSYHLVQHFRAEEAALEWRAGRAAAQHRQAHRLLAGHLRHLLDRCHRGGEVRQEIQAFLQAWRDHQEGPLHAQAARPSDAPPQGFAPPPCA